MIVGLVGYSGSGKSAIAKELERREWAHYSPSEIIQNECIDMLSMTDVYSPQDDWSDIYENKELYRPLMEWFGAWARMKNPSYVTDKLYKWMKIQKDGDKSKNIVISNLRYPDEVAMVQEAGGVIVGVIREGCGPKHIGEMYIPFLPINIHLENSGTPEQAVDALLCTLGNGLPHNFPVRGVS